MVFSNKLISSVEFINRKNNDVTSVLARNRVTGCEFSQILNNWYNILCIEKIQRRSYQFATFVLYLMWNHNLSEITEYNIQYII